MAKLSSRVFNQDVGRAKRAADEGPVVITDRGKPAYVLMTYETFRQMAGAAPSILDLLDQKGASDSDDFAIPQIGAGIAKPAMYG
jgi:prevent-host-death family protein